MGRVYAVASAKGGVGKTTTTANLGATLAAAGHRVVVVDADVGLSNLARVLGVSVDGPTLHDVLAGEAEPTEAMYKGPEGLVVVPGSPDLEAFSKADPKRLRGLLAVLEEADVVLVDTGAGLSHDTVLPLTLADGVLLVSTPTPDALSGTAKTREVARRLDARVLGVVLTQSGDDVDYGRVASALPGVGVLGRVPTDAALAAAVTAGEPLVSAAPDSPAAAAYRRLADRIRADAIPVESRGLEPIAEALAPEPEPEPVPEVDDDATESEAEMDADAETAVDEADTDTDADSGAETAEAAAVDDPEALYDADAESADADAESGTADADAESAEEAAADADADTAAETATEADADAAADAGGGLAATLEEVEDAADETADSETETETVLAGMDDEAEEPLIPDAEADADSEADDAPDAGESPDTTAEADDADESTRPEGVVFEDEDDEDADTEAGGDDDTDDDGDGGKKKGFLRRLFG